MSQTVYEKRMQQELANILKRHDHTTTQHYGANMMDDLWPSDTVPSLPKAADARRATQHALNWRAELTRIALTIKEAAKRGQTQIRVDKAPEGAVRKALRDAGYLVDFAADGLTISWVYADHEPQQSGHPKTPLYYTTGTMQLNLPDLSRITTAPMQPPQEPLKYPGVPLNTCKPTNTWPTQDEPQRPGG